jgi:hypothetical protein
MPIRWLQRSLTMASFALGVLLLAIVVLGGLLLLAREAPLPAVPVTQEGKSPTAPSSSENLSPEKEAELAGLRSDLAKLNSQLDQRKDLSPQGQSPLISIFSPRTTIVPESGSQMRVRNARPGRDLAAQQWTLDFELHNVDPQQSQERGYILVLAKANDILLAHPSNSFQANQNILLDFTKGETFAVSRFRQARATFPALGQRKPSFQILLFGTDGKILVNQHVEGEN